jgi:hypothetical protein
VGCFPRPDVDHIGFTAPLALPLFAFCLIKSRPQYRYAAAAVVIGPALALSWLAQTVLDKEIVPTPRGDVVFERPDVSKILMRITALPPGDGYFFYPFMPMLPFLSEREHVSRYDVFVPGFTLPSQYHDACISVMSRASWVVIDREGTDPKYLKLVYPAMENPQPQETMEFERALRSGFEFVVLDGRFELRHRREGSIDAICTGIVK